MHLEEGQHFITILYLEKIANMSDSGSVQGSLNVSAEICPYAHYLYWLKQNRQT